MTSQWSRGSASASYRVDARLNRGAYDVGKRLGGRTLLLGGGRAFCYAHHAVEIWLAVLHFAANVQPRSDALVVRAVHEWPGCSARDQSEVVAPVGCCRAPLCCITVFDLEGVSIGLAMDKLHISPQPLSR